jgi:flagellar capping protein FliD
MKEITENGQTYCVSDSYPKKPYVKYIKNRGEVIQQVSESITERLERLEKKIDDLNDNMKKAGA